MIKKIQQAFSLEIIAHHEDKGQKTIVVRKDKIREIFSLLKNDPELSFDMLIDICGVDFLPKGEKPRFEVVYHFYSLTLNHRLRVRVKLSEEDLKLPSIIDIWRSADWFEREVFDMFGVIFEGHPYLKRLLLFEGFQGHPLRKDFVMEKRQKLPEPEERL